MELIAIAGTVVALTAVIGLAVVAFRPTPTRGMSDGDPEAVSRIARHLADLQSQVDQLTTSVATLTSLRPPEPLTPVVRQSDDHLEEQVYFVLRGVIAAQTAGQPMRRLFCPGAVRCDDTNKRTVLLAELDSFLKEVPAHRVGGRHRSGSWHFRFHIYTGSGPERFTQELTGKLRGYIEKPGSMPLAQVMATDPAAYLQLGPVVLVRTGFDFHATVLSEAGMIEFAEKSRLDHDPSLILGQLKGYMVDHFSLVRPDRRGK